MAAKKTTKKTTKTTTEKVEPETSVRMHTITLKEKDAQGRFLYIDVDQVLPVNLFGESCPMVMAVIDDRAYFIPIEQMNWFEQNYGVQNDAKIAKTMHNEKMKRQKDYVEPVGAEFV